MNKNRRIRSLNLKFTEIADRFTDKVLLNNKNSIFGITDETFDAAALEVFRFQYAQNTLYRDWVDLLGVKPEAVRRLEEIPFLPIEFFKTHKVLSSAERPESILFTSSGTSGSTLSKHIVTDPCMYEESFFRSFRLFYGDPWKYCFLSLLPGYLERNTSSLVYMVKKLAEVSRHPYSGFYLQKKGELIERIHALNGTDQKVFLIGVSYALLDLCEEGLSLKENFTIMETGGMKGKRREMLKPELHDALKKGLGIGSVHSEYGMTELLSQAYSRSDGLFESPPWMRFLIRETDDPLQMKVDGRTGGINIIDLANLNSCAFIATRDLGRLHDGRLELMGRFDNSDIRGCNLMLESN